MLNTTTDHVAGGGRYPRNPAATPGPGAPSGRRLRTLIGVLMLVQFVGMMSGTIIATALPAITDAVDGTTFHYTWMFVTTALASTVTTPLWGRLGDVFDAKRVLLWSIGFYSVGAFLCGIAPSVELLIAARVVQGIGIGGHIALTQVLAARLVAPNRRAQVNAAMGLSQVVASAAGPVVGALLVGIPDFGWRLCFLLNVPVALAAGLAVQFMMPAARATGSRRVDYLGAVLITTGSTAALIWISLVNKQFRLVSPESAALAGSAALVLALAFWWVWRTVDAIVPVRTLIGRAPFLSGVASTAIGASLFGGTIFVTQYLQLGRGMSPLLAGMMLIPMTLAASVGALTVGRLAARSGTLKRYLMAGSLLVAAGNACLIPTTSGTPMLVVVVATCLTGAGLGMTAANLVVSAQNAARAGDLGAVTGAVVFCRTFGSTVGLALFGAIVAGFVPSAGEIAGSSASELYADATSSVFLWATAISVIGVAAIAALPAAPSRAGIGRPRGHRTEFRAGRPGKE